jgi:hypothetical protein
MRGDSKATIKIGGVDYSVDVTKTPYLESFVQMQRSTQPAATEFIHRPIDLFDVAIKGVELGYRQCFRSLPPDLCQYRTLFQTYDFLKVDILRKLSIDQVIANLKAGKSDYDPDERRQISGNKRLARDTAFQLLYLILFYPFEDKTREGMKLFNAVMFVVSHPGTFKYRAKRVVRLAFEERFGITVKQRLRLDQWNTGEDLNDATTDEDPDCYFYSSDDSF